MKIRKAKKKDFEEYFKLEKEFCKYNNKITPFIKCALIKKKIKKNFTRKLNKKNKIFLVIDDGKNLQGYLFGEIEYLNKYGYKYNLDKRGYLENTYITEKYRGQGYFFKMFKQFIAYLKKHKIKYCALHVETNNKKSIKTYESIGFKIDSHRMTKRL